MSRKYTVPMPPVTIAAAQDLWQIKGATGKMLRILRVVFGETDTAPAAAQMLSIRCRHLPSAVTDGTGGTTATIGAQPGDAAASFTALLNNTGKASSASAAVRHLIPTHSMAGIDHVFLSPPEVGPSQSFVIELLAAPSGTFNGSGYVEVEELGG